MDHTVEELYDQMAELRVLLKLGRLFSRIEDDLREIRRNMTATNLQGRAKRGSSLRKRD